MKEKLSCLQCKGIVCTDLEDGVKAVGNLKDGAAIKFPQNVSKCPMRKVEEEPEEDIEKWFALEGKVDTLHLGS